MYTPPLINRNHQLEMHMQGVHVPGSFVQSSFSAPLSTGQIAQFDTYTCAPEDQFGPLPTIVLIQELPGIGPETLSLANTLVEEGYKVVLPHLLGPLGKVSLLGNTARVFCMRREFHLFEKNASSPIVDWLKALCRDLLNRREASAIGVIGMCLSGNFAISMMADESVLAGVASQPSLPLFDQTALHMSEDEIQQARDRLSQHGPMLALRFNEDPMCTAAKFESINKTFNDDQQRIDLVELPGKGHSVLTLDLIKAGEPGQAALQQVLSYFASKLKPASID